MREKLIEIADRLRLAASAPDSPRRIEEIAAELRALAARAQPTGEVGPMDLSAPPMVWLQIDTSGNNDDRSQPIPRESWDELTWCAESVGGQEVVYVRQDLAFSARAQGVPEGWRLTPIEPLPEMVEAARVVKGVSGVCSYDTALRRLRAGIAAAPAPDAAQAKGEAVAWIRFCSDGSYEGPIHDSQMGDIRRRSGAWTPLGVIASPAQHAPTGAQPSALADTACVLKVTRSMAPPDCWHWIVTMPGGHVFACGANGFTLSAAVCDAALAGKAALEKADRAWRERHDLRANANAEENSHD